MCVIICCYVLFCHVIIIIIKTFVSFFIARTTHSNTHVLYIYIWRRPGHTTHTRRPEVAVNLTHPGSSLLQDPPGAVGSFSAPGDQVNRPSRSGTDRVVLVFLC